MSKHTGAVSVDDFREKITKFVVQHPEAKGMFSKRLFFFYQVMLFAYSNAIDGEGFRMYVGDPIFSPMAAIQLHPTDVGVVQEILKGSLDSFTVKSPTYDVAKPLIGKGILSSSGPIWKQHRLLIESGLNIDNLRNMAPGITSCVDDMINRWLQTPTEPFDCRLDYLRLTLRVFSSEVIGFDSDRDFVNQISDPLFQIFQYVSDNLAARAMTGFETDKKYSRHMKDLNFVVGSVVKMARNGDSRIVKPGPVLRGLLAKNEKGEYLLTEQEMMDEIKTLAFAGHDTTGNSLAWGTFIIATNAEVRGKLEKEVETWFPHGGSPTLADVDRMIYLNYFVKELLRLHPPASFQRKVVKPINLPYQDVYLPTGVVISINPGDISTASKYVERADEFIPERWADDSSFDMDKRIYFPFSLGPRNCVGMRLALMEMKLAFVRVLQRVDVKYVGVEMPKSFMTLTIGPENIVIKASSKKLSPIYDEKRVDLGKDQPASMPQVRRAVSPNMKTLEVAK
ncbi:hypothetical protein HDU76_000628 [Blyttiomyces sp. JEL0837]|nr:hypothetical protein HDU76_000628 [Blyttiomyces sp. JEL0837]